MGTWSRRRVLGAASGLAAAAGAGALTARGGARRQRNLLLILSDDHRGDFFSCEGHPVVRTPRLDGLAGQGVRFSRTFSTTSICNPSRAGMLTGLYGFACGVPGNRDALPVGTQTALSVMRRAGVHAALFGKWGVTGHDARGEQRAGEFFDRWLTLKVVSSPQDGMACDQGKNVQLKGYTDEVVTGRAIEYLDRLCAGTRAWCLTLSFRAPHEPFVPSAARAQDYSDAVLLPPFASPPGEGAPRWVRQVASGQRVGDGPAGGGPMRRPGGPGGPQGGGAAGDGARPDRAGRPPLDGVPPGGGRPGGTYGPAGGAGIARSGPEQRRRDFLRCIATVDDLVGQVLDHLDTRPCAEDTVVIYSSDNGAMAGDHGIWDKRCAYEPSIRIPLLVRAPMLPVKPGTVVDDLVLNTDLAPTLLEALGVPLPRGFARHGRSVLPYLLGERPADWRRDFLYHYTHEAEKPHPTMQAVRDARWKYIVNAGDLAELYDLSVDPAEAVNLAADPAHAAERARLHARLLALRREIGAPSEGLSG